MELPLGNQQGVYDWDQGVYNSLDAKLTHHVTDELHYLVAFTWGHSINYGAYRSNTGDNLWSNNSPWKAIERGDSQFNQPLRLVGSFKNDLPFGQGKGFAPSNPIVEPHRQRLGSRRHSYLWLRNQHECDFSRQSVSDQHEGRRSGIRGS